MIAGLVLLCSGTGLAQEETPVPQPSPTQEAAPGGDSMGVLSTDLDVEIYSSGSADGPDEDDVLQMICYTPEAAIYYTTDGSEPTESSTRFDEDAPPRIGDITGAFTPAGFTVRARAFLNGESSASIASLSVGQVVCREVEFTPGSGVYPAGTQVSLSCGTPGAQIYYQIDDTPPDLLYTGPIPLTDDMQISVYAECAGYQNSYESAANYQIGNVDVYEPNDTFEQATPLSLPADLRANISNSNDLDYFSFSMPSDRLVHIALTQPEAAPGEEDFSYMLQLFNAAGDRIDVSEGVGTRDIRRYLAPGAYYVLVSDREHRYSAAEYGLAISTLPMDAYDFSEYNLVNSAFHPDSPFHFESRYTLNAGAVYTAIACLSRWDGYLMEQQDPYILYYDEDGIVDRSESFYHTAQPSYRLKDVVMLPPRADALDNAYYKNAIFTYGALYCGIQESPDYYNDNKSYFYHPEGVDEGSGHAVTVVGWDDGISRENFRVTYGGQEYVPDCDGAFLAKNSYGEQTGESGYFYISYCSAYFSNNAASAVIAEPARSDVNVLYLHDPYGYTGFWHGQDAVQGKEVWAKNVFTASTGQALKAVSFYALGMDQAYDVYVDTGGGDVLVASGVNRHAGYYTVGLQTDIRLETGAAFSITVRQENLDGLNVAAALERPTAGYAPNATAAPGQSFLSFDGAQWQDISAAMGANNCVKAYAYDDAANANTIVTEETGSSGNPLSAMGGEQPGEAALQSFTGGARAQAVSLPAAFDLRGIGAVTSVKNQGNPPTCWTFATMGSTESCLLKAGSGFDTGVSLSLDVAQRTVYLDEGGEGYATATVRQTGGSGGVYWQFAGDVDAVDIENRAGMSGQRTVLFHAKREGVVTATAVSLDDGTKSAQIVFDIRETGGTPAPTTPQPDPAPTGTDPTPAGTASAPTATPAHRGKTVLTDSPKMGDPTDIRFFIAALSAAGGASAAAILIRNRKTGGKQGGSLN